VNRFPLTSLRFYLIALVLLSLLPPLTLTLVHASEARRRERVHVEADALQLAHVVAAQERDLVETTQQLLITLGQVPELKAEDPQACQTFLDDLQTHYHRYTNLGVIAPDGAVSCSAVPPKQAINVADRAFFQQALSSGEFTVGEYQVDSISQEPAVPFAYPVYNEVNQIQAVIFATVNMDWLNHVESGVLAQLPRDWALTKVDRNGVVLVHEPDPTTWSGRSAIKTPLVQAVLEREQGVTEVVGLDDTVGVYAFAPVPSVFQGRGIYVILGMPRSVAFASGNRILLHSLVGLGLVAAVVLVVSWAVASIFVLRPVDALLRVKQQLAEGELSARVHLPAGPQELVQLGLALNQMADSLERRDGDLRLVAKRLSILHDMDSAILEAKSPDEIAFVALSKVTQIIHCVRACVVTFDFETHEAVFLAFHADGETRLGEGARVPLQVLEDVEFETLRRGEVHMIENARSFCQPSAIGPTLRAHVPLVLHGELIGSLNLELDDPESFSPDHVHVAGEVADSLAVAIHNVRLLEEVSVGHERLQALSHRLIEVQEVERRTIARELHDEIGQSLTSVKINLQTMQHLNDSPTLATHLEDGIRIIDQALHQVRNLSFDLRPSLLDDLGLVPALRSLLKRQAQRARLQASFRAGPIQQQIPPQVEIACFRIVQESLTNVMRHAQAQQVIVELGSDRQALHLLIRDDGIGFDVQAALQHAAGGDGLGLLGMEERAVLAGGRLTIQSTPGQGTEIQAHFPWPRTPTGTKESPGRDAA